MSYSSTQLFCTSILILLMPILDISIVRPFPLIYDKFPAHGYTIHTQTHIRERAHTPGCRLIILLCAHPFHSNLPSSCPCQDSTCHIVRLVTQRKIMTFFCSKSIGIITCNSSHHALNKLLQLLQEQRSIRFNFNWLHSLNVQCR